MRPIIIYDPVGLVIVVVLSTTIGLSIIYGLQSIYRHLMSKKKHKEDAEWNG